MAGGKPRAGKDAYLVGIYSTPAGRFFETSPKELVRDAFLGALADARFDGGAIGHVWFSNMLRDFWGQPNVKGQVCLRPIVEEGVLPAGVATTNVEAACASGRRVATISSADIVAFCFSRKPAKATFSSGVK